MDFDGEDSDVRGERRVKGRPDPCEESASTGTQLPTKLPASIAGRFLAEQILGRGAHGVVYRARNVSDGSLIALKFLTSVDALSLFRFKSEFRTLANLVHPNLLKFYELSKHGDAWLLCMELVEGTDFLSYVRPPLDGEGAASAEDSEEKTVTETTVEAEANQVDTEAPEVLASLATTDSRLVAPGLLDEARIRASLRQLAEGLYALHSSDRLHRDLKPANVLVSTSDGRVVICDFGLTLEGTPEPDAPHDPSTSAVAGETHFTSRAGEIAGTLAFMSPEQAQAKALTPASDWYSVGVMLYLALTGRLPHRSDLPYPTLVRAKLEVPPIDPAYYASDCPRDLAELSLALLRPDPRERPGYAQFVEVVSKAAKPSEHRRAQRHIFVGRESHMVELARAFEACQGGAAGIVLLSGVSGMGKSSLAHNFLRQLEEESNALVLRGRCYEREELPYKALDPLVDALTTHLLELKADAIGPLLPPSIGSLVALFPALRRVPSIDELSTRTAPVNDPLERRRSAFRAFRELCQNLTQRRPLVLFLDDLQWGDLDSAPLFRELLTLPEAPAMLLVCAYRSEDEQRSPLLRWLRQLLTQEPAMAQLYDVSVLPLAPSEAKRLALSVMHGASSRARKAARLDEGEAADFISAEAEGSPFFVHELANYVVQFGLEALQRVRLTGIIKAHLDALSSAGNYLLSLVALTGRPVASSLLVAASGLSAEALPALRELEARQLVLSSRGRTGQQLECFHDRIREAVTQAIEPAAAQARHRALAEALERAGVEDSELLLRHWRGAGERARACHYALADAQKAERALAFQRAADLYREALELLAPDDPRRSDVHERLAHALVLAGRGADAAEQYLMLAPTATPERAHSFRMLATTQLLRTGRLVQGFAELSRSKEMFGVAFPRSTFQALCMLLWRRFRLFFRRGRMVVRPEAKETELNSARLSVLWDVTAAVSTADFISGSVYGAELTLRATEVCDPMHIAGACGLEAVNAATRNDNTQVQRFLDLAEQAGAVTRSLEIVSRVRGVQGACRQLQGRWLEAIRFARESQELQLRLACVTWDFAIMSWWELVSAAAAGRLREVSLRIPEALRDAEARGDVYTATGFRTHRASWAWLALDKPDVADQQVDIAEREWAAPGFQFQHWHMLFARGEVDLYRGTPRRAWDGLNAAWPRTFWVRQVQGVRSDMLYTRARLALALARREYRPGLLRRAVADGRALVAQAQPWTRGLGLLVLGSAASFQDRSSSISLLARAEVALFSADMPAHAQAARARRGELLATPDGRGLQTDALTEVARLGAKVPERFVQLLAPTARA